MMPDVPLYRSDSPGVAKVPRFNKRPTAAPVL